MINTLFSLPRSFEDCTLSGQYSVSTNCAGSISAHDCLFTNIYAGAVTVDSADFALFRRCAFIDISSPEKGGSICLTDCTDIKLSRVSAYNSSSVGVGVAFYLSSVDGGINTIEFVAVAACSGYSRAIHMSYGTLTAYVYNSTGIELDHAVCIYAGPSRNTACSYTCVLSRRGTCRVYRLLDLSHGDSTVSGVRHVLKHGAIVEADSTQLIFVRHRAEFYNFVMSRNSEISINVDVAISVTLYDCVFSEEPPVSLFIEYIRPVVVASPNEELALCPFHAMTKKRRSPLTMRYSLASVILSNP